MKSIDIFDYHQGVFSCAPDSIETASADPLTGHTMVYVHGMLLI